LVHWRIDGGELDLPVWATVGLPGSRACL